MGPLRFAGLPGRDKTVEIRLPHDGTTELVALRTDAATHLRVGERFARLALTNGGPLHAPLA